MDAPTVVFTTPIDDDQRRIAADCLPDADLVALDGLPDDERLAAVDRADALVVWTPGEELTDAEFAALSDDQYLQTISAGVDYLPFDRLPAGMTVLNNAGAYADPMAEHVLAMYLALAKRLLTEHRKMANGEFDQFATNRRIEGSTCAVFGLGAIGEAVARRLRPLGVEVLAINRSGETDAAVDSIGTPDDLDAVLDEADSLVVTAPLTPETRGRIGRAELDRLGTDGLLVNVARGEIIEQKALYEHLDANPEFRAGIEAWWTEPVRHGAFELDYPFFELSNVLGSPHNSASVPDVTELRTRHAMENVARALESGDPKRVVNRELGY